MNHPRAQKERNLLKHIPYVILTFIVYPIAGVVLGYLGSRSMGPGAGPAIVRLVLLVQCVLLACVVPFFCSADAAARPITNAAGAFISSMAGRLGAAAPVRQMATYAVAALMLGTVFYANPAIAAMRGKPKLAAVQTAVAANPMVCVAGAALDYDILLSRRAEPSLYTQSLIGPDHLYRYPRWWAAGAAYSGVGLVMLFISFIGSKGSIKQQENDE